MNEGRVPAPEFNQSRYERPNSQWVCGHASEGCPCRVGPSPDGKCRATTECSPRLVLRPGEKKGTWACTRPADWGGPCASGPLPDGTCCRPIIACRPVRSMRERRGLVTCAVVAACLGGMLVGLSGSTRDSFVNPRALSTQHSGAEFAHMAEHAGGGRGCVLCHVGANDRFGKLLVDALEVSRVSLRPAVLVSRHPKDFSQMDHSCLACHAVESFHQADVARDTSCSACHREHLGDHPMAPVDAANCIDCHGDQAQMLAARQRSLAMPATMFVRSVPSGRIVHSVGRPAEGYTEVITGFSVDHPEFRVLRENSPDLNTLKFNHRLHLTGSDIPPVNGRLLDCAYCHKPDASGAYMARISFEQSCRACHALGFRRAQPGDDPSPRRRGVCSRLPAEPSCAVRRLCLGANSASSGREIDAFVGRQMQSLRERAHTGEDLERAVFLSEGGTGPAPGVAGAGPAARARFEGCATCHEVAWRDNGAPFVTPPQGARPVASRARGSAM